MRMSATGSCLSRIRGWTGTGSSDKIARFVLAEPRRALSMSIERLAEECGISTSTLSRFCMALGYSGYKEFKLDLAANLALEQEQTLDDFEEDAPPGVIVRRVFECNRQSLADTLRLLDHDVLFRVARAIHEARHTVFLGIGGSGLIATLAAQRFMSLGLPAVAMVDPCDQVFVTGNVRPGDAVVGISHTGQTGMVVEGVREAARRRAVTAGVTNYPHSPLADTCRYCLLTAFREHRINAAMSSSRIAQMCVIDALYFIVAGWCPKDARALADAAETRVRRMLRGSRSGRNGTD